MDDPPPFFPEGYSNAPLFDEFDGLNKLHGNMVLSTPLEELTKRGMAPSAPESVTDADLAEAIKKLYFDLESIHVYLEEHIEHLPERELYELLWNSLLKEPEILGPDNPDYQYHWDVLGGWSEEDTQIWLRYYASEEDRQDHVDQWGDELPISELPPYPKPWLHDDFTTPI